MVNTANDYTTSGTTSQQDIDTLAREYIRSLEKGIMPKDRPNFDKWEAEVWEIEHFFFDHDRDKDLPTEMATFIKDYCKQNQDLARLLDYKQLARDYFKNYIAEVKTLNGSRPPSFGEYESLIKQYEGFIKKGVSKAWMADTINNDQKVKKLLSSPAQGVIPQKEDPVCPPLPKYL
jgi:hypothetical protein